MHVWKKPEIDIIRLLSISFLFLLSLSSFAETNSNIDIKQADGEFTDEHYMINAKIQYQLGEEIQEALAHGIALQIDIHLLTKQQRQWIWDTTIESSTISYRLEHHPLSGHYQVTNMDNYHRKHFQNLQGALDHIGLIKNYIMLDRSQLLTEKNYIARIRTQLNIQNLPAPLRLLAYVSPQWNLKCPWYEWPIPNTNSSSLSRTILQ